LLRKLHTLPGSSRVAEPHRDSLATILQFREICASSRNHPNVPNMFSSRRQSIINVGKLLFKMLLMKCRNDKAATQASAAAAR
ncbi:hypothetical protein, partial [Rhizobium phaseoli]|uniref:hypothetical protein n=1 Tax=Rhizobium phaseoli TaxID=396 RepID=UPI001AECE2CF